MVADLDRSQVSSCIAQPCLGSLSLGLESDGPGSSPGPAGRQPCDPASPSFLFCPGAQQPHVLPWVVGRSKGDRACDMSGTAAGPSGALGFMIATVVPSPQGK